MNHQILESLLMDQAFGELSPECDQLLTAYLEEHPEYKTLAESISNTAAIGQEAVARETPQILPSFSLERMQVAQKKETRKYYGRWWVSTAACLVFGILIGVLSTSGNERFNDTDLIIGLETLSAGTKAESPGLESVQAFWSAQSYIKQFQENRTKRNESNSSSIFQQNVEKFKKRGAL